MRKMNGKSEEEKVKHYNHTASCLGTFMFHIKVTEEVKNILSNPYVMSKQELQKKMTS